MTVAAHAVPSHRQHLLAFWRTWSRVLLTWIAVLVLAGCGGSSPTENRPLPPTGPPPVPPPTSSGNITLTLLSGSPMPDTAVQRGLRTRLVTRLRYDAADSTARPLFLVAHLTQFEGANLRDDPSDFHFPTPDRSGEVEAVIERDIIATPGTLRIAWTLAMVRPDGTSFAGASFTTSYPIQ